MSRSKHTIPHTQSSPCVNLSIGARAGRVEGGAGRGGAKDRKQQDIKKRDIKGSETWVFLVRNTCFICAVITSNKTETTAKIQLTFHVCSYGVITRVD